MQCLTMHSVQSYRDLIVWQKSMDLVVEICSSTQSFPRTETGLISHLRRAAVSIPSNSPRATTDYRPGNSNNFLDMRGLTPAP